MFENKVFIWRIGGKMKAKIFTMIMSFIFLLTIYSNTIYAITNEIVKSNEIIEDTEDNSIIENTNVENTMTNSIDTEEKQEPIIGEIMELPSDTKENSIILHNEEIRETYQGSVCIDRPTHNQTIIRPDETKLSIGGWAVSNDEKATVRVLLDGTVVGNNLARIQRADVDRIVSPSYGGTAKTPKAGYNTTIDISNQSAGSHRLRVEEISRYGEVIDASETTIQITNRKYQGSVCIDRPMHNQTITRPDETKLSIGGWAVSNDEKATVRVLLDGTVVGNNLARIQRADVDRIVSPSYGGTAKTPKAGYNTTIDISNQSAGSHRLRVEEISRYGEVIDASETTIQITNRKYQGNVCIDRPTYNQTIIRPDETKLSIGGWAVSNDEKATVRVLLDGTVVGNNLARIQRADVDRIVSPSYGGTAKTPKAGYNTTIDISNQSAGSHRLRVEEISRYGEVIDASETTIQITNRKYQGSVCIDRPMHNQTITRPDETKLSIGGWAVSNDEKATVRVLLDGTVVGNNLARIQRADVDRIVSPSYGGTAKTPKAGYNTTIDISNQSAGSHRLRVEEISRYGEIIGASETTIQIANRKYQGSVCIDTPINAQSIIKSNSSLMTVVGWAVSNDEKASLRLLLDGKLMTNNLNRTPRADVDKIVSPSYGGTTKTPRAGFNTTVNIADLNVGIHVLRIEQVSRYGEIINVFEVGLNVANPRYLGEMCVDTPTFYQTYNHGDNMAVGGWAVAQDEEASVEIYVDHIFKAKAERYFRADVTHFINKYGAKTIRAGFGKLINTADMSAGTHTLTVYEKSRYGDVIAAIEVKFNIKSKYPNPTPNVNVGNNSDNNSSNNVINTSGTKGIDVSQYQGKINWNRVAGSGIKYAMIRIGYRGYGTGGLVEDPKFKENFAGAVGNGLKTGVYFYSTAINQAEAKKDAEYVVSLLKKYGYQNKVSMPIAIDLELIPGVNTRDKNVSKSMRTSIANTFGSTIANYGYTPMIYACKSFLNDNMNASQIGYDVWVAQYNANCTYRGPYTMWQYTSTGKVSGINGNVDCNLCYKNY